MRFIINVKRDEEERAEGVEFEKTHDFVVVRHKSADSKGDIYNNIPVYTWTRLVALSLCEKGISKGVFINKGIAIVHRVNVTAPFDYRSSARDDNQAACLEFVFNSDRYGSYLTIISAGSSFLIDWDEWAYLTRLLEQTK